MPLYQEHKAAGVAKAIPFAGVVLIGAMFATANLGFGIIAAVGGGFAVLLGSVFPDVDHHKAIPHRRLKKFIAVVFTVVTGYIYIQAVTWVATDYATDSLSSGIMAYQLGLASLVVPAAGVVGAELVSALRPKHRGPTHTKEAGLVVGLAIGLGVWYIGLGVISNYPRFLLSVIIGLGFYIGVVEHLSLDGLIGKEKAREAKGHLSSLSGHMVKLPKRLVESVRKPAKNQFSKLSFRRKVIVLLAGGFVFLIIARFFGWIFAGSRSPDSTDSEKATVADASLGEAESSD